MGLRIIHTCENENENKTEYTLFDIQKYVSNNTKRNIYGKPQREKKLRLIITGCIHFDSMAYVQELIIQ